MVTLKKFDSYGQLIIIFLFTILTLIYKWEMLFGSYFMVGGWQVSSVIIQKIKKSHWPEAFDRNAYQWFLVIAIAPAPLGGFYLLLFIAPFAAVWYLAISFRELRVWEARQLIQLR